MTERLLLHVTGMTCAGCENAVRRAVGKLAGVREVTASHEDERVEVTYETDKVTRADIATAIQAIGYLVGA